MASANITSGEEVTTMADVVLYTTQYCPYCVRAKRLLKEKNVVFKEIKVDNRRDLRAEMMQKSGQGTVPQIWIGRQHIGGCDELYALERAKKLDGLLAAL